MLIDAAKGLEPQTLKLFRVCKARGLPIVTVINKWDRPGRTPLELVDDSRLPDCRILFVGGHRGPERLWAEKAGLEFARLLGHYGIFMMMSIGLLGGRIGTGTPTITIEDRKSVV